MLKTTGLGLTYLDHEQHGYHFATIFFDTIEYMATILGTISSYLVPFDPITTSLVPNRRRETIWTNGDPVIWRIYASPGTIRSLTNTRCELSSWNYCSMVIWFFLWCSVSWLPHIVRSGSETYHYDANVWKHFAYSAKQGLYPLKRHRLTGIAIPIINPRRSDDRLMFIMGIPIPIRRCLLSEWNAWNDDVSLMTISSRAA